MADRFPSLDELDSGHEPVHVPEGGNFLDRERAVLGEDAAQFEGPNDHLAATVGDGDDDNLLGDIGDYQPEVSNQDITAFESQFPAIDTTNDHIAPGGTIGGSSFMPGDPPTSSYTAPYISTEPEDEPEVIMAWREKRAAEIHKLDMRSEETRQETVAQAKRDLDDFYENYNAKVEKSIAQTRREAEEFLNSRDDTTAGGTSWERIAKLVDLSGKGARGGGASSGKERFREMLLSLKKDEKAPGAAGY